MVSVVVMLLTTICNGFAGPWGAGAELLLHAINKQQPKIKPQKNFTVVIF
jgi:hypothetical protein